MVRVRRSMRTAAHHHEPIYHKHTRVTDAKTLELVKQAAGLLQHITARLSMSLNNTPLQGRISTSSGNFIIAQPLGVDDGWTIATADAFVVLMRKPFIVNWTAVPLY